MTRRWTFVLTVATVSVMGCTVIGCSATRLGDMSLDQGATVTDFEYRMTLDNLAMFRTDQGSLPWHLDLTNGTAQIDGSIAPSATYTWPPTSRMLSLSASRGITINWTLTPTLNDEQLGALRTRYLAATQDATFNTHFEQGSKAPQDVPYGEYKGLYVWPKTGQLSALTELVLAAEHDILIHPADEPGYKPGPAPSGVALTPHR